MKSSRMSSSRMTSRIVRSCSSRWRTVSCLLLMNPHSESSSKRRFSFRWLISSLANKSLVDRDRSKPSSRSSIARESPSSIRFNSETNSKHSCSSFFDSINSRSNSFLPSKLNNDFKCPAKPSFVADICDKSCFTSSISCVLSRKALVSGSRK